MFSLSRLRSIGAMPTAKTLAERALRRAERELLEAHDAVEQATYDLHAGKQRVQSYQVKIARLRAYIEEAGG
ncbi:MAG: hypothetical protein RJA99_3220 [Pseudomonadota bacterium]|jgi:predicted deacylase